MMSFVESIKMESQVWGVTLPRCIARDVRDCTSLEHLAFDFLVLDQEVFCLRSKLSERDPVWALLRATGIDTLIHMPSWPLLF
jgi:hypothetical protein